MINTRTRAVLAICVLAALGGCAGAASPAPRAASAPASTLSAAASSPPVSADTSPSPSPSPSVTVTQPTSTLPVLSGYSYVAAPVEFTAMRTAIGSLGVTSSVAATGVQDQNGNDVAVVVIVRYTAKLARALDVTAPAKVLDAGAAMAASLVSGKTSVKTVVDHGHPVRVLQTATLDVGLTYLKGGRLVMVFGGTPADVEAFMGAFLIAS